MWGRDAIGSCTHTKLATGGAAGSCTPGSLHRRDAGPGQAREGQDELRLFDRAARLYQAPITTGAGPRARFIPPTRLPDARALQ